MSNPVVPDGAYSRFCELVYQKTGLFFNEDKRYFVETRIKRRMKATGAESFRSYFVDLRFARDNDEMQQLVNELTVNETHFNREPLHFDAMIDEFLPDYMAAKAAKGKKELKIWCIPCSTGEEPYTIAMHMLERLHGIDGWDVHIHASDIDTRVVEHAQEGVYNTRSVKHLPPQWVKTYFHHYDHDGQKQFQISDGLRESVDFSLVNMTDPLDVRKMRGMDVIFCRNVLFYFDEATRSKVANHLHGCLNRGGLFYISTTESMSRVSNLFKPRRFEKCLGYVR
ncbi:MAG: protein-glutamate O-methyltransferase CheR [Mariprofundales bacterium]